MTTEPPDDAADLEGYREYLLLLARLQLDTGLQGKVDVSGVVQQTLLEAYQNLRQLQGQSTDEQRAWLRRVLANNLLDEVRKFHTQGRDVNREQSLCALEASSARLESWLAAEQSSPSQQAMRNEQLTALAQALAGLPEDQRQAIEMHHWKGMSLKEVAAQMQRSKGAVAALLFRGVQRLREVLQE